MHRNECRKVRSEIARHLGQLIDREDTLTVFGESEMSLADILREIDNATPLGQRLAENWVRLRDGAPEIMEKALLQRAERQQWS